MTKPLFTITVGDREIPADELKPAVRNRIWEMVLDHLRRQARQGNETELTNIEERDG